MVDEYDAFSNEYIGTEIVNGLTADNGKDGYGCEIQPWEALSAIMVACLPQIFSKI
jgi:hypothetical protein